MLQVAWVCVQVCNTHLIPKFPSVAGGKGPRAGVQHSPDTSLSSPVLQVAWVCAGVQHSPDTSLSPPVLQAAWVHVQVGSMHLTLDH